MLTRRRFFPLFTALTCYLTLTPKVYAALGAEEEIHALINAIESSGCQFIRNGERYSAVQAAEHLRLKYRKGKNYAATAEAFIDNLASQSSITKTPYYLLTPQGEHILSGVWLRQQLTRLRATTQSAASDAKK